MKINKKKAMLPVILIGACCSTVSNAEITQVDKHTLADVQGQHGSPILTLAAAAYLLEATGENGDSRLTGLIGGLKDKLPTMPERGSNTGLIGGLKDKLPTMPERGSNTGLIGGLKDKLPTMPETGPNGELTITGLIGGLKDKLSSRGASEGGANPINNVPLRQKISGVRANSYIEITSPKDTGSLSGGIHILITQSI